MLFFLVNLSHKRELMLKRSEMKTNKVRYQDMTESERNELIAYTAGMEAHSSENIEKLRKAQTSLQAIVVLDTVLLLIILTMI